MGSFVAGVVVDKTKWFQEVAKVSYSIAGIAFCAFALVSHVSCLRNFEGLLQLLGMDGIESDRGRLGRTRLDDD